MSAAQNTRVVMVRRDLERIPDFSLPPEFSLRFFEPGDEEHWRRIHVMADLHNPITPELFRNQFGTDDKLLADRQLYLLAPDKEPIGTATAWFDDEFEGGRWGRIHWVSILPAFQNRGLGKAFMTRVCHRLRELGHKRAYLTTSSERLAAIRLYKRFGFVVQTGTAR